MTKRRQGTTIVFRGADTCARAMAALLAPKLAEQPALVMEPKNQLSEGYPPSPPGVATFTAKRGTKCDRCGDTWGRSSNTAGKVYHLCLVAES